MKTKKIIDLDMPLLHFGHGADVLSLREMLTGTTIFGATGAGKTSSSGKKIANAFLINGFGGLVLTAKNDDKDVFLQYCIDAGREKDVIIIEPGYKDGHRFNFLEYESQSSGDQKAITSNILEVLKTVIEAGAEKDSDKGEDQFFSAAADMLICNVCDLCLLAYGKVTVELLYNIVQSLPRPETGNKSQELTAFDEAYDLASKKVNAQVDEWKNKQTDEFRKQNNNRQSYIRAVNKAIPDARLFHYLAEYFLSSFKFLSPKTRTIIELIISGFLYKLLRDPAFSLFCDQPSTVVPEDCFDGKIIIVNLPVKIFHSVGRDSQLLVKYCWQRAMEKRKIEPDSLPVFLWVDEAHHFTHEKDADFQATARSSRICNVQLTQNLPNFYAAMGGNKAEYKVKSFLGNFGIKIWHSNTCIETNSWGSSIIGEADYKNPSVSTSFDSQNISESESAGIHSKKQVRPEDFQKFRTGGPQNQYRVQAIIHRQGTPFSDGENFKRVTFYQQQNFKQTI